MRYIKNFNEISLTDQSKFNVVNRPYKKTELTITSPYFSQSDHNDNGIDRSLERTIVSLKITWVWLRHSCADERNRNLMIKLC